MNIKELKIEFRYLCGSIACMSVNSTTGKPIHNDINDDDAIKIFNALIGSKENSILEENRKLKEDYEKESYLVDKYTRQLTDEYKNTKKAIKQRDLYKSVIDEVNNHCELMLRLFEKMNEQQRDENLEKFTPYDKILRILDKSKHKESD